MSTTFDPNDHLITLQGKKYLEVKWRLVWLREKHPDAIITTEILEHNQFEKWCVVRATVTLPGGGSATGMARQEPTTIAKDYIANCETSAIGRALGALGFGTQHAVEFDQGEQVADAPVAVKAKQDVDPELELAKAALVEAMKAEAWTMQRLIETASWVWPQIRTKADLGTLTAVQLGRLTEVIVGTSVIHLDTRGHKRIMTAPAKPTVATQLSPTGAH
jgi:hypothetical protein